MLHFPPSVNNTYFVFFTNILQFLGPINLKTIYSIFNFMLGGKNCLESYRVVMHILFYVYVFFYLLFSPGIATYVLPLVTIRSNYCNGKDRKKW